MVFYLTHGIIYSESFVGQGYIKINNGLICDVGPLDQLPSLSDGEVIALSEENRVIPGMIDVHIHGVQGADVMDGTIEALQTMSSSLPAEGTTSFLATTITQEKQKISQALSNVAQYMKSQSNNGAECLGIHLEGPFISPEQAGAQPRDHILDPDVRQMKEWQAIAENHIRLVTLAPEERNGLSLIQHLTQTGVIASIGHSNASYEEVDQAIQAGASHITHLFNGMSGIHHREPGVAGSALLRDELMVELIADGVHVRPEIMKLVYQQAADRLLLITDSMRAKCLKSGVYDLGGQQVRVENGQARLESGALAGSILKMNDAFKNFYQRTDSSIEDMIKMTSTHAAKELGVLDRKGTIAPGKDADIVILDNQFDVAMTFCQGNVVYERGIQDGNRES